MTNKKDEWRKLAEKELRGRPLDDLTWNTLEGIPVQPLYTAEDTAEAAEKIHFQWSPSISSTSHDEHLVSKLKLGGGKTKTNTLLNGGMAERSH
jgi:hypothetical protein